MTTMDFESMQSSLQTILHPLGFETHPFKISWYNDCVKKEFQLDYPGDTIAFIIISTPSMFEKAFRPFLMKPDCLVRDPIDDCVAFYFNEVKKTIGDHAIDTFHDFERHHNLRPKVLVQTAGHVAGAARYYQISDVKNPPWPENKRIFGVSVHPVYGGWFALRGVMVVKTLQHAALMREEPPDVVNKEEDRIELLSRFNGNWKDGTFRDIIPTTEKYSEEQKLYFATDPKDRKKLVEQWRAPSNHQ